MTQIYKLKGFARYQRKERISDASLRKAIGDVEAGLVDANLGTGLVKQRLARAGREGAKRFPHGDRVPARRARRVLYGFAKNGVDNIDAEELDEFRRIARGFFEMGAKQLAMLIKDGEVMEVSDEEGS